MNKKIKTLEAEICSADFHMLLNCWRKYVNNGNQCNEYPKGRFLEYAILREFELEILDYKNEIGRDVGYVKYPYNVPASKSGVKESNQTSEQIDGLIVFNEIHALAEFKDYHNSGKKINVDPISKFKLRLLNRPADTIGILFSRTPLTDNAKSELSKGNHRNIIFWSDEDMEFCMSKRKCIDCLKWKHQQLLEYGDPTADYKKYKTDPANSISFQLF